MDRRRFIVTTGTGIAVGLAGCLGGDDDDTESPEAVVEAWYDLEDSDSDEVVDDAEELLHSESPILALLEAIEEDEGEGDEEEEDINVESVEAEVVEEDLSQEQLEEEVGFFDVDDETLAELADEEDTARVEADVELSGEDAEEDSSTDEFIVVTEDGEWQIFI